jgi:hypothetical protein
VKAQILSKVDEILKSINSINGYGSTVSLVQYGDGTPSEYDGEGIEVSYMMPSRTVTIRNKRWDWEGILQVVATIYGDDNGIREHQIEADIFEALGKDQSLGQPLIWNWPSGMEHSTERAIAGKYVTMLTLTFPIRYSTEPWET